MPQTIQRTVIMTHGDVARQAGAFFQRLLTERCGPEAAVAVVNLEGDKVTATKGCEWQGDKVTVHPVIPSLTDALTRISPTSLVAQLAQQGYSLDTAHEIALFLLVDISPQAGEQVVRWVQEISAVIRSHLGIEAATLLVWLTMAPSESATTDCLVAAEANRHLFSRGILALGPLNESGLRLPEPSALAARCAELLWLLITTPLRTSLEWLNSSDGDSLLGSVGCSQWEWDAEAIQHCLETRWLSDVITQWLTSAATPPLTVEIEHWAVDHHLTPEAIKKCTLTEQEQQPPLSNETAWHAPWPWQLQGMFTQLSLTDTADHETQTQRQEWADMRLEEPLRAASQVLRQQVQGLLHHKAVGGIATACQWLTLFNEIVGEWRNQLLLEKEEQETADSALSTLRGELETNLHPLLLEWPPAELFPWIWVACRPWRWPRLVWHYWRLRAMGQQLRLVYHHQAIRRRQQAMMAATLHACTELEQIVRRLYSQTEEIGDMLHCVKRAIGDWQVGIQAEAALLPIASVLYSSLVKDSQQEAEMAAAAVGGLGEQLTDLDDKRLLTALRQVAAAQLVKVEAYSAVSIIQRLHPTPEALCQWWQNLWEDASPLWRYDPTSLPEPIRAQETALTCLLGVDAPSLVQTSPGLLPPDVRLVESSDLKRLFVLRLRGNLTASAMIRNGDGERGEEVTR